MKREIPKELESKIKKNMTRLVIIIVILAVLVAADVLCVVKLNKGPFLAIRTKVYDDGGTKEYYGLGYKVIKYHQKIGRRDIQIGFWNMPYSVQPTEISSLDLALELRNYPEKTYNKFYRQYMKITGTISKVDKKKKTVTIHYEDEEKAYTLDVICYLTDEKLKMDSYEKDMTVEVVGTFGKFKETKEKTMQVDLENSFILNSQQVKEA